MAGEESCSPCWKRARSLSLEEACSASRPVLMLIGSVMTQHLAGMIACLPAAYDTHEVSFFLAALCFAKTLQDGKRR
jgi:hypothetical protein